MELKNQTCGLELSVKLKKLGVNQLSLFYHDTRLKKIAWWEDIQMAPIDSKDRYISAFTVAELGNMMPCSIKVKDEIFRLTIWRNEKNWSVFYGGENYCVHDIIEDTEADARAKMLIYLIEEKLYGDQVAKQPS